MCHQHQYIRTFYKTIYNVSPTSIYKNILKNNLRHKKLMNVQLSTMPRCDYIFYIDIKKHKKKLQFLKYIKTNKKIKKIMVLVKAFIFVFLLFLCFFFFLFLCGECTRACGMYIFACARICTCLYVRVCL